MYMNSAHIDSEFVGMSSIVGDQHLDLQTNISLLLHWSTFAA